MAGNSFFNWCSVVKQHMSQPYSEERTLAKLAYDRLPADEIPVSFSTLLDCNENNNAHHGADYELPGGGT
jgi:hypothetical protein